MAKTVQKYLYLNDAKTPLKVSKFQKQIFSFSFEPKKERNYSLNSALASKMSQINKMKAQALCYINRSINFFIWPILDP